MFILQTDNAKGCRHGYRPVAGNFVSFIFHIDDANESLPKV
jgi:hypothetical protein